MRLPKPPYPEGSQRTLGRHIIPAASIRLRGRFVCSGPGASRKVEKLYFLSVLLFQARKGDLINYTLIRFCFKTGHLLFR